jgi:hypothetical protein
MKEMISETTTLNDFVDRYFGIHKGFHGKTMDP